MRFVRCVVVVVTLTLFIAVACQEPRRYAAQAPPPPSAHNVVVWISIDGFRGDYVDRGITPLMRRLMHEGVYSQRLLTSTPSLTFPSHVTEATGVPISTHGIVSNEFYDTASHETWKMPEAPTLMP